MTPYRNAQLNMNSLHQNGSYDYVVDNTMMVPMNGNRPCSLDPTTYHALHGVDSHAQPTFAGFNSAYAVDDEPQSGWASDVFGTMPDTGEHSNPGLSNTEDIGKPAYAYEASHDATFADIINYSQDTPVFDNVHDKGTPNVKVKYEDDDINNVRIIPSQSDEYEESVGSYESDGGYFEGSRANATPKTNKDGGKRKPRQPRAKLLKWSDNDWRNVVLGIIWACGETGTQIPFDQAAQIIGETCTAGALQQAVLKLRQKQVAEGNWIPPLKMAWTRKSKHDNSSVFNTNDAKVTKDYGTGKTTLKKKKATRFSSTQSLIITLKRVCAKLWGKDLAAPHVVNSSKAISNPSMSNHLQSPVQPQTPIQKRRARLQVTMNGSPQVYGDSTFEELHVDTERSRTSNRDAAVNNRFLYQSIPRGKNTDYPITPSPSSTSDWYYHAMYQSPVSFTTSDHDTLSVATGPVVYSRNNTSAATAEVEGYEQSHAPNPQGSSNYTTINTTVVPQVSDNGMYNSVVHNSRMGRKCAMVKADAGFPERPVDIFSIFDADEVANVSS